MASDDACFAPMGQKSENFVGKLAKFASLKVNNELISIVVQFALNECSCIVVAGL